MVEAARRIQDDRVLQGTSTRCQTRAQADTTEFDRAGLRTELRCDGEIGLSGQQEAGRKIIGSQVEFFIESLLVGVDVPKNTAFPMPWSGADLDQDWRTVVAA